MYAELDHWIFIGIGEDIMFRPEYKENVALAQALKIKNEHIPAFVLGLLFEQSKIESKKRLWKRLKMRCGSLIYWIPQVISRLQTLL